VYRHMMRSVESYLLKKYRKRLMLDGRKENKFFLINSFLKKLLIEFIPDSYYN